MTYLLVAAGAAWLAWQVCRASAHVAGRERVRRAFRLATRRGDARAARQWAAGYAMGHALGLGAGRAQVEREWARLRLGVEAKRAPMPVDRAEPARHGPNAAGEGDGPSDAFRGFSEALAARMRGRP